MRFIDKTGCKSAFEKGASKEVKSLGKLTRTATKKAEENKLGVLKTRQGFLQSNKRMRPRRSMRRVFQRPGRGRRIPQKPLVSKGGQSNDNHRRNQNI